jgi:uncharacterized tellurite resistance protein B-like protein
MNLVPVLASLFVLLFLTALVGWFVLYIQFCRSVEKRWANQVLHLVQDAENCVRSENRQLLELKKERDAKADSLREEAFAAHLCAYSVEELDAYPGIGPVTIGKLRAAGFINLAKLHRAQIHVHGLGKKRLADIKNAIRGLLGKARNIFDDGNCRQARELAEQLETLSTRYDGLEAESRMRARAAEEFIDHLGESVKYARRVTFWRWFRPISKEAFVPSELIDASLPDLETAMRTAEQRFAQSETAKRSPLSTPRQTVPQRQAPKHAPASAPKSEPEKHEATPLMLMELTIQFAFGVARKDGPVTGTERELIRHHIRQRSSYDRALLNRAETLCVHFETTAIDFERCLAEINRHFTASHRTALMEFAGQIVAVSGKEASRTTPFLLQLAQSLDVPPLALPQREPPDSPLVPPVATPSKPAAPTKDECRSLLEIPAETPLSADLVRRQWNLLSERMDPEKVAAMGPEFVKLAQDKLATLRQAAESFLESMGEKLETKPSTPPIQDLRHNPDLDDVFGGM